MAIDPFREDVFSLKEAARRVKGRKLHVATIWRWATKGLRGRKLETIPIGGVRCTTEAAMRQFFAATVAVPTPPPQKSPGLSPEEIERQLRKFGI